jgi:hypothetical protein
LEPVLSLRRREDLHDGAVERGLFSADVAKQFGEVVSKLHGIGGPLKGAMFTLCSLSVNSPMPFLPSLNH